MIAILALAAVSLQPAPSEAAHAFTERAAGCGIAAERIEIRYEPALQAEVAFVAGRGVPSDETLACVAQASVETQRIARFVDPDADTRFGSAWADLLQRLGRDMAREWLRERGRLEALPSFDPQRQTLAAFAVQLEAFCGVSAGTALRVEAGMLTFSRGKASSRLTAEQTECLANAAAAAAPSLDFGLLGTR